MERLKIGRRRESGLVILDLYPQGLGLIEALNDDDDLLRRLLEYTRDWLAECPCAVGGRLSAVPAIPAVDRRHPLFSRAAS